MRLGKTRGPERTRRNFCACLDLNQGPRDYESPALTAVLQARRVELDLSKNECRLTLMPYVVKAAISNANAKLFNLRAQKTMYGGKDIRAKDEIFIFSSETEGGPGLIARGVVTSAAPTPVKRVDRKVRRTPRVSVTVRRVAMAKRRLGRSELKAYRNWGDGRPESELCFKFYRQATNKIGGISEQAAAFLRTFFKG